MYSALLCLLFLPYSSQVVCLSLVINPLSPHIRRSLSQVSTESKPNERKQLKIHSRTLRVCFGGYVLCMLVRMCVCLFVCVRRQLKLKSKSNTKMRNSPRIEANKKTTKRYKMQLSNKSTVAHRKRMHKIKNMFFN